MHAHHAHISHSNPACTQASGACHLALALALALVAFTCATPHDAWGDAHKGDPSSGTTTIKVVSDDISNRWDYDGSGISTRLRWAGSKDSGNLVYCINPGVNNGPGEGSVTLPARLLDASDFKSEKLYHACLAALYYAPGGPGYKTEDGTGIGRNFFPDTDWRGGSFGYRDRFATAHCLMGFYYNGADWDDTYPLSNKQPSSAYRNWFLEYMVPKSYGGTGDSSFGKQAFAHFNDDDMLANGGYTIEAWEQSVFLVMTGDGDKQDLLTYIDIPRGPLSIHKESGNAALTDSNPGYSLKGAVYTVYSDASCTDEVGSITTDASGGGSLDGLMAGTYYVKETKAAKGYLPDTETHKVKVKNESGGSFVSKEPPRHIPLDILVAKVDATTGQDSPQGDGALSGAAFDINFYHGYYDKEADLPQAPDKSWKGLTTDKGGRIAKSIDLPLGTYTVKESAPPRGYLANSRLFIGQIVSDDDAEGGARLKPINYSGAEALKESNVPVVAEEPKTFGFSVSKTDALLGAQAEGDASLAGAVFSVVNDSAKPVRINGTTYAKGEECLVVKTKKVGNAYIARCDGDTLPYGSYIIREKQAPTGYLLNDTWQHRIASDDSHPNGYVFDLTGSACADTPICGGLKVPKIDHENRQSKALGAASLEGAELTITLDSEQPVKVDGNVYHTGDIVKIMTTGADGTAATGDHDLPYGTYTVREARAPNGYLLNDTWKMTVHIRDDGEVYAIDAVDDQVKRGDVRLNKAHAETMDRMGGVAFLVTSKTTGEQHVVVSDENGSLDTSASWASHAHNTNANDKALVHESQEDDAGNSGEDTTVSPGEDHESSSSATSSSAGTSESGDDDGDDDEDDEDDDPTLEDGASTGTASGDQEPDIGADIGQETDASSSTSSSTGDAGDGETPSAGDAQGNSTPSYDFDGAARDIAAALGAESVQIENTEKLAARFVTAVPGTDISFTASVKKGGKTTKRTFIATPQEDGSVAIRDADTDDEVAYLEPPIDPVNAGDALTADAENEDAITDADTDANPIADKAMFTIGSGNDIVHEVRDTTADAAPDEAIPTIDDEKIDPESGVWFSGRTDLETEPNDALGALPYDTYSFQELRGKANRGMSLVSFNVIVHRDSVNIDMGTIDDTPIDTNVDIKTTLAYGDDLHLAPAIGQVELIDTVSYTGLTPNTHYELRGYLVDKDTGETVGETVSIELEPTETQGTTTVSFQVDASKHAGTSLVAFEELYENETCIAEHKDIEDDAQTVSIPAIATSLSSAEGKKAIIAGKDVELADRVDYRSLVPGIEYSLKATLHAKKDDGSDGGVLKGADGKEVVASATFTPQAPDGSATVTFTFDASQVSGQAVAFEELWFSEELYAEHKDIGDPSQTVKVKSPKKPTPPTQEKETPPKPAPPTKEKETPPTPTTPDTPKTPTTPTPTPEKGTPFAQTGNLLTRFWWVVLIVTATGTSAGMYVVFTRRPQYSSWE